MSEYRIYVACLASYNAGRLHGAWIDCDGKGADELADEVNAMLRESPFPNVTVPCPEDHGPDNPALLCDSCDGEGRVPSAEEYAIHDHEGFGALIEEYTSFTEVAEIVEALEGADDPEALREFAEAFGYDIPEAGAKFADAYHGQWSSKGDYAEDYVDSCGLLDANSWAARYFDYEAFARDLFLDGYTMTDSGHVFSDNH